MALEWSKRRQNNMERVDVQLQAELQRLVGYRAQELITKSGRYVRHHAPLNVEKWSLIPIDITDKIINIIYDNIETLSLCKRMMDRGECPLMVVFDPHKGDLLVQDFVADDRSIALSYGPCEEVMRPRHISMFISSHSPFTLLSLFGDVLLTGKGGRIV
ncbi:Histone-lysine N-methyltransferase ATXR6 [Platanthera zijinensis]|uniref:Histone-lysine N-methyltransferase ATXR6 n=1 Tax=Platanthera zijinensis TaxID=2320716 RepID=A0AAP0C3W9_9ASPA